MARREYLKNGIKFDSITSVLGIIDLPWKPYWYGKHGIKECQRIGNEARNKGSAYHACLEHYYKQMKAGLKPAKPKHHDPKVQKCIDLFWKSPERHLIRPIDLEVTCYYDPLQVAGTFDMTNWYGDVLCMSDHKSGKHIPEHGGEQLSALKHFLVYQKPELQGVPIERRIFHVHEDMDRMEVKLYDETNEFENDKTCWNAFLAALYLFRQRKKNPAYSFPEEVQQIMGSLGGNELSDFELEM